MSTIDLLSCYFTLRFSNLFSSTARAALDRTCLFPCTADYRPVCGNDLKTYPNECTMRGKACMNGAAIIAVYKGECREERKYNLFESVYEGILPINGNWKRRVS